MFSELIIVIEISAKHLWQIVKRYPESRTVFWDQSREGAETIAEAAQFAGKIYARPDVCEMLKPFFQAESIDPGLVADDPRCEAKGPVLFCPSNDTHVKMFAPVAARLPDPRFLLFDRHPGENSRAMAKSLGLEFSEGGPDALETIKPSVIVFGNDWYPDAWRMLARAQKMGIPTACLQEGCLDFQRQRRMQWCDTALIQGPVVLDHFFNRLFFITGNPRFDDLAPNAPPEKPLVMINSNFTYGVFENARDAWVRDAATVCDEAGARFFISQHPRDKGKFPDYEVRSSGAGVIHEQLADSSLVVTRFSTLIYEALLLGRQAIYFNPHGEDMRLFNQDKTGGIYIARDRDELVVALKEALETGFESRKQQRERFIRLHCTASDGNAARRVAKALLRISEIGGSLAGASLADRIKFRTATTLRSLPLVTRLFK